MKSIYLMRTGKWDESFVQIKISVEKSKEVLTMLGSFENEKQKMHIVQMLPSRSRFFPIYRQDVHWQLHYQ